MMTSAALPGRGGVFLRTEDFRRALTDKKEYRLLTLPNGLEVFLVADKNAAGRTEEDGEDEDGEEEDDDSTGSLLSEAQEDGEDGSEDDDDDHHEHHTRGTGGCAVAMAVGVGSFNERLGSEPHGLAHLLEHMLFMGSEKYPTENAYDDHLSKNGGYSNAYTETQCTVYCTFALLRHQRVLLTTLF